MSNSNTPSPWPSMIWLGILCGLSLGLLAAILYRDKRRESGGGFLPDLEPSPTLGPAPRPALADPRPVPVARTLTVGSRPVMVLKALGASDWKVNVSTIGPPTAFATFMIGRELGNAIVVPAGSARDMRIPRGEFLYVKGSELGVCVSVAGGSEA